MKEIKALGLGIFAILQFWKGVEWKSEKLPLKNDVKSFLIFSYTYPYIFAVWKFHMQYRIFNAPSIILQIQTFISGLATLRSSYKLSW